MRPARTGADLPDAPAVPAPAPVGRAHHSVALDERAPVGALDAARAATCSSSSLSRCAASVDASPAGRSCAGHVRPDRVEQLARSCARPSPSATISAVLAVDAVVDVLLELARAASHTGGPWPGQSTSKSSRIRSRVEREQVAGHRAAVGAMKTLPSPSTASPVKHAPSRDQREVVQQALSASTNRRRPPIPNR